MTQRETLKRRHKVVAATLAAMLAIAVAKTSLDVTEKLFERSSATPVVVVDSATNEQTSDDIRMPVSSADLAVVRWNKALVVLGSSTTGFCS